MTRLFRVRPLNNSEQIAGGSPYVEQADRANNQVDRALLHAWGHLSPYFLSSLWRSRLDQMVQCADDHEQRLTSSTDQRLRETAIGLRARLISDGSDMDSIAVAFALAREAARRHTGMRHFRVQLFGGAAMLSGALAEMQTGEGKSLTALLPAVAGALMGCPVHVITVNEYLARRDAEYFSSAYNALGLSVGVVEQDQSAIDRQRAYACDVTYCTNKDIVFDYLRDRLAIGARRSRARLLVHELFRGNSTVQSPQQGLLLRGLHFAIVDEADSVLVDEARTPLILSGRQENAEEHEGQYHQALEFAGQLVRGEDFDLEADEKSIRLTEAGDRRVAGLTEGLSGLWRIRRARQELVTQALTALHFFRRDVQYIVADGKIQIVDEYTGRVMPNRSWDRGLHQLVEAKEGCEITGRSSTLARITYQRFFRRYVHLCGMTGTAMEAAGELRAVYGLRVVRIPTNRPACRKHLGTRMFPTTKMKWEATVAAAKIAARSNRAVLIGTRSVEASEQLAELLAKSGLQAVILNARQDRQEAEIIAAAGQAGRVTVATNMAGRGTDIELDPTVKEAGGLHVILTEYHESRRIDRQLFGRAGRQGDVGTCETIVSLEDELFQRFAGKRLLSVVSGSVQPTASIPVVIGRILLCYSQSAAERLHARARRRTLMEDHQLSRALGFAGTE